MFQDTKPEWAKERTELKSLLTPEEYDSARASVLNAHYTSADVINGMWDALKHLGFKGGRALEPASGVGHFLGLTPASMRDRMKWTTTELDKVTGAIAKQLYQRADVNVQGFETLNRPNGFYDLAMSNVPFGSFNIRDLRYKQEFLIHDYFFVRSLDLVRPGGIVAFITSSGTMDKANDSARAEIMKRADLVGAIRLPGGKKGAFAGNAGTEVTTDIIFLRRKGERIPPIENAWQNTKEIETPDGPVELAVVLSNVAGKPEATAYTLVSEPGWANGMTGSAASPRSCLRSSVRCSSFITSRFTVTAPVPGTSATACRTRSAISVFLGQASVVR